jgi:NADH:ubiquinone oxidoreductase subunit 6 (subunit J)
MFMFFYSGVVVLFFLGASMGVSQWMLGMDAPWLWSIPACILLYLSILAAAKFGQFRGRKQMIRLWRFLDHAIDEGEKKEEAGKE